MANLDNRNYKPTEQDLVSVPNHIMDYLLSNNNDSDSNED